MATRELAEIKDKNGDVNELRDKKLADSIAKNTVVNTDNVRMVDTNGKEVFIARDSFISAIRNVLGGFILSNTKAEAPNIPVFDSNGDFGAITAANLASVLGVQDSIESFEVAAGETKSIYYSGGFMLMADSYWGFYRIYALKYQGGFDLLHQNNSEMSIKVEHTGWHLITVKNEPSLYNQSIHVWLIIV